MPTPKYFHLITILDGITWCKKIMMKFPDYKSKYPLCIFVAKFQKSECNHFLGQNRGSLSLHVHKSMLCSGTYITGINNRKIGQCHHCSRSILYHETIGIIKHFILYCSNVMY